MTDDLETAPEIPFGATDPTEDEELGLVIVYAADDPEHIGAWISAARASATVPGILGRGAPESGDDRVRLKAVRQRPGSNTPLPPLASPTLSREQILVRKTAADVMELTNVGRRPLHLNGRQTRVAEVREGDVVDVGAQLVLLVATRPPTLRVNEFAATHAFGNPDAHGFVGESKATWRLRGDVAFVGGLPGHVLITGATGTGKEIVATALHRLSGRDGPLVARNAATFPESLVDAELFGNLKGYPNPGMSERKGLVGAAHGGTLFLDEFAELGPEAQAKLLRVLDSGEYQTLGESRCRRSDFRLIATTNRPESHLRQDLLARFDLRVRTPSLAERREDLAFLVRHLLNTMTEVGPALRERLFKGRAWPDLSPTFVQNLVRSHLPTNVRGLRALLWRSISHGAGQTLEWPDETPASPGRPRDAVKSDEVRELERVLEENGGSIEGSWRALGLPSRYALMRLLRKHRITVTRRSSPE